MSNRNSLTECPYFVEKRELKNKDRYFFEKTSEGTTVKGVIQIPKNEKAEFNFHFSTEEMEDWFKKLIDEFDPKKELEEAKVLLKKVGEKEEVPTFSSQGVILTGEMDSEEVRLLLKVLVTKGFTVYSPEEFELKRR